MADNELYRQQDDLLHDVGNKYTKNWGSLLNFIGRYLYILINYFTAEVEDASFMIDRLNQIG